jgi:hypothetical protein
LVYEPEAIEKVSPALTVFDAVSAPNQRRTGVPVESYSSTPITVQAGIPEYVSARLEAIDPADAAANVIV